MVAFRGRRGSLPEAAHPTVEGSRPGARRHVAHEAVAARPRLGPDESSPACPELVVATCPNHGHHVCPPTCHAIAGACALHRPRTPACRPQPPPTQRNTRIALPVAHHAP